MIIAITLLSCCNV